MLAPPVAIWTPADSARAVGDVYGVSLLATVPVLAAIVAFVLLRRSNAGTRAVMWRCAVSALLVIYAGRFLPWQWVAWILPDPLTRPLVSLGTLQLDLPPGLAGNLEAPDVSSAIPLLLAIYWGGVAFILFRTLVARVRLAVVRRQSTFLSGPPWDSQLVEAGHAIRVDTSRVRLAVSNHISVPVTWGVWRPVILFPPAASRWPAGHLQAVLRHELVHVSGHDSATRLAARVACALLWFHPGVWWLARRFEVDAEEASDDRVLLSGIRLSDYAEWLAASTSRRREVLPAMAFAGSGSLRDRLAVVTDVRRRVAVPSRRIVICATAFTVAGVVPLATARLAPTRRVLTSLMQETRWESRAWAVVRLAQRADSVDVARSAARHDPDPTVRAWARYALSRAVAAPSPRARS